MLLQMFQLILFKLIFVGSSIVFFSFIVYTLRDQLPSWEQFKEEIASFTKVGDDTSHSTRSIDMESQFKVPWEQWDPQAIENLSLIHI